MKKNIIFLIVLCIVINIDTIQACTAFLLKHNGTYRVGLNFDFSSNQGMIMINPRGIEKKSIPFPFEKSAKWTSKYGSLTFNFLGREEPMEGMNEKGLIIAALFLPETQLPSRDKRPIVDDMQWIQYMLDNCKDVNEVVLELANIRISKKSKTSIHYFLSDSVGNFAIIEFIEGKCIYYVNDTSTNGFISNYSFNRSANILKQYNSWGGIIPVDSAYARQNDWTEYAIVTGANMIKNYNTLENIDNYAFNIVKKLNAPNRTQWSIIFNCKDKVVQFITINNSDIRTIDLKSINFECTNNLRALSIIQSKTENIYSQFKDFSPDENLKMFKEGIKVFLHKDKLPFYIDKTIERVANIPYLYKCK